MIETWLFYWFHVFIPGRFQSPHRSTQSWESLQWRPLIGLESFTIASRFTFINTLFNEKYAVWNISRRFSNFLKTQKHTKCYTTGFVCDDYSNGSLFTPALNSHLSILLELTNIYTLCKPDVGNWCKYVTKQFFPLLSMWGKAAWSSGILVPHSQQ